MARIALPSPAHGPAEMAHSGICEISNEAMRTPGAIRLDVGQPNFPTSQYIKDAAKKAIDDNMTFYTHTQGLLSLREKLVDKLARVNSITTSPDLIACAPGGHGRDRRHACGSGRGRRRGVAARPRLAELPDDAARTAFGREADEAVRISVASSEAALEEGVGRLAEFVHGRT